MMPNLTDAAYLTRDLSWEQFLRTIREEYQAQKQPVPGDLETQRYSDLVYTVRLRVVLLYTRDIGAPLNAEDFNSVVNGRMSVHDAYQYLTEKANPKTLSHTA